MKCQFIGEDISRSRIHLTSDPSCSEGLTLSGVEAFCPPDNSVHSCRPALLLRLWVGEAIPGCDWLLFPCCFSLPHSFLSLEPFNPLSIYAISHFIPSWATPVITYPYVEITFHEYQVDSWFERSEAFVAIERYLSTNSSNRAKKLKAKVVKDCESVVLSLDENEEVIDEFNGIQVWWTSSKKIPQRQALFSYHGDEENRFYRLICRREHRDVITKAYVKHVLDEGKAIAIKARQRKLYTNNKSENWHGYKKTVWSHIIFEHPFTFDTLAMDPKKKKEILNDLITFSKSKDYYKKVGKSWKRGYLL